MTSQNLNNTFQKEGAEDAERVFMKAFPIGKGNKEEKEKSPGWKPGAFFLPVAGWPVLMRRPVGSVGSHVERSVIICICSIVFRKI